MANTFKISQIRRDGGTQNRCKIDEEVVAEYSQVLLEGGSLPPVQVHFDGTNYWLTDGFHRVQAAIKAEHETVEAEVTRGDIDAAVLYSLGVNAKHGLRRTNADKRKAVTTILTNNGWSQWSDSEISRRCCVSDHLVATVRAELSSNSRRCGDESTEEAQPAPVVRKVERGGKTFDMNVKNNGKKRAVPAPVPAPEPTTPVELEKLDQRIPEHLLTVFQCRQEFRELVQLITNVRLGFEKLAQGAVGSIISLKSAEFEDARDALRVIVLQSMPQAVCQQCHAEQSICKSCRECQGRGWLTVYQAKHLEEESMRTGLVREPGRKPEPIIG